MIIDAVFTWVDGDDPDFLVSRRAHSDFIPPNPPERWRALSGFNGVSEVWENPNPAERDKARFRNLEELRYAMRSVEMYAPWVRNIYLVTNGQVPSWLDTTSDRVKVVEHKDIFEDQSALPCFNSNAIELNLDNIEGLAEHFIYFNDDVFLGRPLQPSNFCDELGCPRMFLEDEGELPFEMHDQSMIGHSWAFNHQIVYSGTKREKKRRMFAHTPQMYTKTLFREIKSAWPEEVALTVRHKFRTAFDFVMRVQASHLASSKKWARTRGLTRPLTVRNKLSPLDYIFVRFGEKRSDFSADLSNLISCRPKFFCINDEIHTGNPAHDEQLKGLMTSTLQQLFPRAASFEKEATTSVELVERWRDESRLEFEPAQFGWVRLLGCSDPKQFLVQWRASTTESWKPLARKGDAVELGLWSEVRVLAQSGPIDQPFVLHLQAVEADNYRFPERGFPRPRRFDVTITDIEGPKTFSVKDLLRAYQDVEKEVAFVRGIADPILYTPDRWPTSKLFAVDHALRSCEVSERELTLLDEALRGQTDPFWIAYRRVLCLIQMGELHEIPETVRSGVVSELCPGNTFLKLARDLAEHGRDEPALMVCEGLAADHNRFPEAIYLRSLCRWKLKVEDPDTLDLLSLPRKCDSVHPGKCFDLWSKTVLGQGMPPQTALFLLDQYSAGSEESSELFLARFRILSQQGLGFQARSMFMHAVKAANEVSLLTQFAVQEHERGNVAGASLALDLTRPVGAGNCLTEIPWAAAMVKVGRITDDVIEILTVRYSRIENDSHFWSIFHVVGALAETEHDYLYMTCFKQLAAAGAGKVKDLIFLSREAWRLEKHETSVEMLRILAEFFPEDPEVLLNWAELSISVGDHSSSVQAALTKAKEATTNKLWAAYHQCRLYQAQGRLELLGEALDGLEVTEQVVQTFEALSQDWRNSGDHRGSDALLASLKQKS